ncbi:MAG: hypothetical protein AABY11_01560, partial [archaeon]
MPQPPRASERRKRLVRAHAIARRNPNVPNQKLKQTAKRYTRIFERFDQEPYRAHVSGGARYFSGNKKETIQAQIRLYQRLRREGNGTKKKHGDIENQHVRISLLFDDLMARGPELQEATLLKIELGRMLKHFREDPNKIESEVMKVFREEGMTRKRVREIRINAFGKVIAKELIEFAEMLIENYRSLGFTIRPENKTKEEMAKYKKTMKGLGNYMGSLKWAIECLKNEKNYPY